MEILYLLIPVSIALVFVIGALFWWALNNQQFDGLDEEASRILFEDDELNTPSQSESKMPTIDAPTEKNPGH